MLHASTRKLIDRLSEMTELGKLDWEESGDGNIAYATEGYSVTLTESPNEVIITSKDGKELERATADEIAASEQEDGTSYTAVVADMIKEAARVARGTETAISTLLAGMEETPADEATEPEIEATEDTMQEDLGDETAVIAAASIETITEEESPSEAPQEEEDPDVIAAEEDAPADPVIEQSPDTDEALSLEASDDAETEATDPDEDVTVETQSIDATDVSDETDPEDVEDTDDAAAVLTDTDVPDDTETSIEAVQEETLESIEESAPVDEPAFLDESASLADQPEDVSPDGDIENELATDVDAAAETEAETETETDVTEAVARMAEEVKDREDTGLETAAASAVGAVALAAGLTPQETDKSETEEIDAAELTPDTNEDTSEATSETLEAETPEPPAYVPFGLNQVDDDDPSDVSAEPEPAVELELVTESALEVDDVVQTDSAPDVEAIAQPESEAQDSFAYQTVLDAVETAPTAAESGTETIHVTDGSLEQTVTPSVETLINETVTDIESASTKPDWGAPAAIEDTSEPELDVEPEPAVVSASADPETPAEETYSLSGIGAGFGLGALSAKTEASGIPGPSDASLAAGEKVVIDATDDVLPKLEGNLNVALAETASAAVSSANASAETSSQTNDGSETDSDILKPRTRFNPWD